MNLALFFLLLASSALADKIAARIGYAIEYAALGDALGAGPEMKSAAYIQNLDLTKFHQREGKFGVGHVPGMITDDTWMSLALMRCLIEYEQEHEAEMRPRIQEIFACYRKAYDQETRFIEEKKYLKPGEQKGKWWGGIEDVFNGNVTFEAMREAISLRSGIGKDQPGNGSLMRVPFVGFLPNSDDVKALAQIDAEATHPHEIAINGSVVLAMVLHHVVYDNKNPSDAIQLAIQSLTSERVKEYLEKIDELENYANCESLDLPEGVLSKICEGEKNSMMKGGGYGIPGKALYTLGAVFYVLKNHDHQTPLSCSLLRLIRMGGDVDSLASIGMAILGAAYGGTSSDDLKSAGFPLDHIQPREEIEKTARDYALFVQKLEEPVR